MTARPIAAMSRTTIAIALLALFTLVALAGCASSTPEPTGTGETDISSSGDHVKEGSSGASPISNARALLPPDIEDTEEINFAWTSYPPYAIASTDENAPPTGIGIDMANALAEHLGLQPTFELVDFSTLIPGIQTGRYDASIPQGAYDTPERREVIDLVDWIQDGAALMVLSGNPEELSMDVLCGSTLALQSGTTYATDEVPELSESCVEKGKEPISARTFSSASAAMTAISSGRAEAQISGAVTTGYLVQNSDGRFEMAGEPYNLRLSTIFVGKESGLTQALQVAMQYLMDNGTYDAILSDWGVDNLALDCALIGGDESSCRSGE